MKLRNFYKALPLVLGSALFAVSCEYEPKDPALRFQKPDGFPEPWYDNPDNRITELGFELGRDLFYEKALSSDSSQNCASCHAQEHSFADQNKAFSRGARGMEGMRNSPALFNLAWSPTFMWDGGIVHMDVMPLAPITDTMEMNLPMAEAVQRIQASPLYQAKFQRAFNTDSITSRDIFLALSQFMVMMISDDSKYDRYMNGSAQLSESESSGLEIFRTHCAGCHTEPLFTDYSFARTGIDSVYEDLGRGRITLNAEDDGKFKVPSLRNVALTYPYMHDGRFFTLREVIDHYSDEVKSSGSDTRIPQPLRLSEGQKQDLEDFLNALTDHTFISDPALADPR